MVPFLYFTLEGFILKEALAEADSGRKLLKINPKNVNIQKPADQVDIGSNAKLEIVENKKKTASK